MNRKSKVFSLAATSTVVIAAVVIAIILNTGTQDSNQDSPPRYYSYQDADTQIIQPDHIPLSPETLMSLHVSEYPSPDNPWLAIILDDFGPPGSARLAPKFFQLPGEVTISIIPGNLKSGWIARAAAEAGVEVFIHLPMEPNRHVAMNERYMVMVDSDSTYLATSLDKILIEIPNAVGLNNHMGSRATGDDSIMRMLARELIQRELMFVDSRTRDSSRGYPTMIAAGIPTLWRDVFLDNNRDTTAIAKQLDELVELTLRRGWGLGIGHACRETLEVLQREMPEIIDSGIRVVYAGELVDAVWKMRQGMLAVAE